MTAETLVGEVRDLSALDFGTLIDAIDKMEAEDGQPQEKDLLYVRGKGVIMPNYTMQNPTEFKIEVLDLNNQ